MPRNNKQQCIADKINKGMNQSTAESVCGDEVPPSEWSRENYGRKRSRKRRKDYSRSPNRRY